jgi:long-chain acyl-CoA synthetase
VLWWGQNCHRLLETLFAVGRLGAVVCAVNWRQSTAELAFVLDDSRPKVVIWQDQEIGQTARAVRAEHRDSATWIQHDAAGLDSYEDRLERHRHDVAPPDLADAELPVLMMYTGAFDGKPNGALLSHRALLAQSMTLRMLEHLDEHTIYLNSGPMFHIGSLRRTITVAHGGGLNVFCRRVDATVLCELIERERCTHAFLQKPTMSQIVDINRDGKYDLSSLLSNGGPEGWAEMVTIVKDPTVHSGYGQTELAGVVTFRFPESPSVGAWPGPLALVDIHSPDGTPVERGQTGEIVVRGPMVMSGYHNRPGLTKYRSRGGWHHTNDLGRKEADGSISFVGPMERIIKSAAENIYPVEVETVLRSHPAVTDAAVLGVPDALWGQRVKAVIVAGGSVTASSLLPFCREHLAGYKCPRLYQFVETLPRIGGQLDRDRLDADFGGGGYPGTN